MIDYVPMEERAPRMLAASLPKADVDALTAAILACASAV